MITRFILIFRIRKLECVEFIYTYIITQLTDQQVRAFCIEKLMQPSF